MSVLNKTNNKSMMENSVNRKENFNYITESECLCNELKHLKNMENVYDFEHCLLKRDIQSYELIKQVVEMRNERDHETEVHCSKLKDKYYMLIDFISDFDIDDIARYNILEKGIQYNKEKDHLSLMLGKYKNIRKKYEDVNLLNNLKLKQIELETKKSAYKIRLSAYNKLNKEFNDIRSQDERKIKNLIVALVVGSYEIDKQINEVMKLKKDSEYLATKMKNDFLQKQRIIKELEADIKKFTESLESQANQINEFGILSSILPKKSLASKIQNKLNLLEYNNSFTSISSFSGVKSFQRTSCDDTNKFNSKKPLSQVYEKNNGLSQTVNNREIATLDVLKENSTDIHPESILSKEKIKILKNVQIQLPVQTAAAEKATVASSTGYKRGAKRISSSSSEDKFQLSKQRRTEKQKRKLKLTQNDVMFLVQGMTSNDQNIIQNNDTKTSIGNSKCNTNPSTSNMAFFENISSSGNEGNFGSFIMSEDEKNNGKNCNKTNNLERSDSFQFDSDSFDFVFDENEKAMDLVSGDTENGSFFL